MAASPILVSDICSLSVVTIIVLVTFFLFNSTNDLYPFVEQYPFGIWIYPGINWNQYPDLFHNFYIPFNKTCEENCKPRQFPSSLIDEDGSVWIPVYNNDEQKRQYYSL